MKWTIRLCLLLWLLPSVAHALPVLEVDTDPSTPGVQTGSSIAVGAPLTVDIVISDVSDSARLFGYEFILAFDVNLVSATLVEDGGFLPLPVIGAPLLPQIPGQIGFGATTLSAVGASGAGVLARVFLTGLAPGTTSLDLSGIVLATVIEPGVVEALPFDPAQSGSLTVVPEPGSAGLVALALGLAHALRRLRMLGARGIT